MNEIKNTLEDYLAYSYEKGWFNGNWLLRKRGEVVSRGSLGIAHPERKNPLNEESIFEMASVSKHFTASAIMILRDRGALALEDPLHKYFPASPYDKAITVRHLLNHTSGLPDYMEWLKEKGTRENKIYPNSVMETFLAESGLPALFAPGEEWSYSNTAYALMALIVEKASGKTFADFMREDVFLPCGMTSSLVYHRRMNGETLENYAYGMVLTEEGYKLPDHVPGPDMVIPLDGVEGDGIVNTTIDDMLRWDIAQRAGTVLSLASQEEMYTPTLLNNGTEYPYGYGWTPERDPDVGRLVQHGGGWPGYNTMSVRLLEEDSMLAYMMNQTGCDSVARTEMMAGLQEILCGRKPPLPQSIEEKRRTLSPEALAAVCGDYEGGFQVKTEEGVLRITGTYREQDISDELIPAGDGVFYLKGPGLKLLLDGKSFSSDRLGSFNKI